MDKLLISVIMPAYNAEKYIEKAIQSVLVQDVSLELLIINDCSTDNTEQTIKRYIQEGKVSCLTNRVNLGAAASRNIGVRNAKGQYIAYLDADDWWEPDKLKKQLALLQENNMVLCSTGRELVDQNSCSTGKIIPVQEVITYKKLLNHNCINCSSVVLKKEVAIEFPMEHEDSHEDYITWIKILRKYGQACAINEPLLKYRISNSSKSGSKLKSAKMTFFAYKYAGLNNFEAIISFIKYTINGLWKYRGINIR